MSNRYPAAAAAIAIAASLMAACQGGGFESAQNAPLNTEDQKASYAIGLQIGSSLAPAESHVQMDAFMRGIQDALADRDPVIPPESLQVVMQRFTQTVQAEEQTRMAAEGQTNGQVGSDYMTENAKKPGVTTTASGLQYEVMREGSGAKPTPTDRVTIHYKGTLIDGKEFDSSYARGEPVTFEVGGVIAGFAEALQLMPVGSQYRFVIPGPLAYGDQGNGGDIGPNATLIFEIELLEIPQ